MLVAGILALRFDPNAGAIVLGLFAVANVAGLLLWSRRSSLSAYKGLQILLPIVGATSLAATYVLDTAGIFESIQSGSAVGAQFMYIAIVGVVVVLMLSFALRERRR